MDYNLVLLAEAIQALRGIQAQLNYERQKIVDALGAEPILEVEVIDTAKKAIRLDKIMLHSFPENNQYTALEVSDAVQVLQGTTGEPRARMRATTAASFVELKSPDDAAAVWRFSLKSVSGGGSDSLLLECYNGSAWIVVDQWDVPV